MKTKCNPSHSFKAYRGASSNYQSIISESCTGCTGQVLGCKINFNNFGTKDQLNACSSKKLGLPKLKKKCSGKHQYTCG